MEKDKLDISEVVSATFGALGRKWVEILLICVLLEGLPLLLDYWHETPLLPPALSWMADGVTGTLSDLGLLIWTIVAGALAQAAIMQTVMADKYGQMTGESGPLSQAAGVLLPIIAVSMLVTAGLAVGLLILVVPGIIFLVASIVSVPALIVERRGVLESIDRSFELTRGHRWPILALVVLTIVVSFLILFAADMATTTLSGATRASPQFILLDGVAFEVATDILFAMVTYTATAVLYIRLRQLNDGAAPETVSDEFR